MQPGYIPKNLPHFFGLELPENQSPDDLHRPRQNGKCVCRTNLAYTVSLPCLKPQERCAGFVNWKCLKIRDSGRDRAKTSAPFSKTGSQVTSDKTGCPCDNDSHKLSSEHFQMIGTHGPISPQEKFLPDQAANLIRIAGSSDNDGVHRMLLKMDGATMGRWRPEQIFPV